VWSFVVLFLSCVCVWPFFLSNTGTIQRISVSRSDGDHQRFILDMHDTRNNLEQVIEESKLNRRSL